MLNIGLPVLLAREGTYFFPPAASTFAKEVDDVYMYILYLSLFFFVLIVAAMVYCAFKFRRRPGYEGDSRALHSNALEITWTIIPTLLVIWIFARGTSGYLTMMRPPVDTIDVNVTARKWAWTFQYPNGAISNELHIPVNQAARMRMRSEDVLHALFVPAFRCKADIVPGRVTNMWFEPILEGTYDLFCAEYCGDEHSNMITKCVVHSEEGYQKWLKEAAKAPIEPVAHGKWLYERVGCKSCHSMEPNKRVVGPSFAGIYDSEGKMASGKTIKVDDAYIQDSILVPQKDIRDGYQSASQMPSFKGKLKREEIFALTRFIEALKDGKLSDEELAEPPAIETTDAMKATNGAAPKAADSEAKAADSQAKTNGEVKAAEAEKKPDEKTDN